MTIQREAAMVEFECTNCHHHWHGELPRQCPACGAPTDKHQIVGQKGKTMDLEWNDAPYGVVAQHRHFVAAVAPGGDQVRWTLSVRMGDKTKTVVTSSAENLEEAQERIAGYLQIQPEPLAMKALIAHDKHAVVDCGYLWHLMPPGLSIQSAYYNGSAQKVASTGTDLVKKSVNENAFGSERYVTLDRTFPGTGWAGHDGYAADHGPAAHNREIPEYQRIENWPSAWGLGADRAPSEASLKTAALCLDCHGQGIVTPTVEGAPEYRCGTCNGTGYLRSVGSPKESAIFDTTDQGKVDSDPTDGDGAPMDDMRPITQPQTTRPQVTPTGAPTTSPATQPTTQPISQPLTSYEQPTMAQRREAKIAKIARQVEADNPGMDYDECIRVARMTVERFPGIIGGGQG